MRGAMSWLTDYMERHDTLAIFLGIAILAVVGTAFALTLGLLRRGGLLEGVILAWVGIAIVGAIVAGFQAYFRR